MNRRGWTFTVFNNGPLPEEDPKLQRRASRAAVRIDLADMDDDDAKTRAIRAILQKDEPDLMVFGEVPTDAAVLDGADGPRRSCCSINSTTRPASPTGTAGASTASSSMAYAPSGRSRSTCASLRDRSAHRCSPWSRTPLPATLRELPRVVVLGLDERVLDRGIEIGRLRRADRHRHPQPRPRRVEGMNAAGIPPERRLSLPLLKDADLYGWIAASRVAIVANGFMQMMEMLALGCPAICVDRAASACGRGRSPMAVALRVAVRGAGERLLGWLRASPFGTGAGRWRSAVSGRARRSAPITWRRCTSGGASSAACRWGTMIDWQVWNWLHGDKRRVADSPGGTAET